MTPPDDLRILVEAAFPGAILDRDPDFGDWRITPRAPLEIVGDQIESIRLRYDYAVAGYTRTLTADAIGSSTWSREIREELHRMLREVSAHQLIAARRRLGL